MPLRCTALTTVRRPTANLVRVCEWPGITANHEPVRSGAVRGSAFGEGTAPVGANSTGLDAVTNSPYSAAKARCHGEAAVSVEPLARYSA